MSANKSKSKGHNQHGGPKSKVTPRRGPSPVLSNKEEKDIVEWALKRLKAKKAVRQTDIVTHVQRYLTREARENPFTDNRPGRSWLRSFFKRHPKLSYTLKESKRSREESNKAQEESESDADMSHMENQDEADGHWVIHTNTSFEEPNIDDADFDSKYHIDTSLTELDPNLFNDTNDEEMFVGFDHVTSPISSDSENLTTDLEDLGIYTGGSWCDESYNFVNLFDDSNDEEMFVGFNHVTSPITSDSENLTTDLEDLDEVNISDLSDKWWCEDECPENDSGVETTETTSIPICKTEITSIPICKTEISSTTEISSVPISSTELSSSHLVLDQGSSSPSGRGLRTASSNPAFKKPFEYGFRREIVYRGVVCGGPNTRRLADVYYLSPDGRKLRSIRDISDYLDERIDDIKLSTGNFTFLKEPIGMNDPTKEIVRDVKTGPLASPVKFKKPVTQEKQPVVKTSNVKNQSLHVKNQSMSVKSPPAPMKSHPTPVKNQSMPVQAVIPRTVTVTKVPGINKVKPVISSTPTESPPQSPQQESSMSTSRSLTSPCSIHCQLAIGLIPTLQCCICVCLYHPICVGLPASTSEHLTGYICPNCRQEKDSATNVPSQNLLLPTVSDHSHSQFASPGAVLQTVPLPLLQTMTTPDGSSGDPVSKAMYTTGPWRPQNMSAPPTASAQPWQESIPQQSLAMMNGKKYVVIPRNSIATAGTSPEEEANKSVPPPMAMLGQPQLQLINPNSIPFMLPKGAFIVNQPGAPGNMLLFKPVESQDVPLQPQYMLMNPAVGAMPAPKMAATPGNLCLVPKLPEERDTTHSKEASLPPPAPPRPVPLKGGYGFTDRLTAHHNALLGVMRYLTVQELLRVSRVCRIWRNVAHEPSLWASARMKNSRVKDWNKCMLTLVKNGTNHLDLRKTILPKREEEAQASWQQFCTVLRKSPLAQMICRIDLCRCPADVVATVAECCSQLKLLSATAITVKGDYLDMKSIGLLQKLQGLRLKSFHGMTLENFKLLENARNLTQLSLTSIRTLSAIEVATALSATRQLELLELGDCPGLLTHTKMMSEALSNLHRLRRVRFEKLLADEKSEKGAVSAILNAFKNSSSLEHLELVNIEAVPGCEQTLAAITSLQQLLIVPSYISHGAKTCQLLLRGVSKLKNLEHLTWVVTNEVLGVTKKLMRAKQTYGQSCANDSQDCIPVLTPLLITDADEDSEQNSNKKTDQLEILPLSKIHSLLHAVLPKIQITFNKVTFQGTWRQSLSDWDLSAS